MAGASIRDAVKDRIAEHVSGQGGLRLHRLPADVASTSIPVICGNAAKADEVVKLAFKHGKNWSCLSNFLLSGRPPTSPDEIASLICETVDACECAVGSDVEGRTALFMVGSRGSGKSTTANWLAGCDYMIKYEDEEDEEDPYLVSEMEEFFRTADASRSVTFLPTCVLVPHPLRPGEFLALVDFAGFKDTCGEAVTIGLDIGFRQLVRRAGRAHALLICSVGAVDDRATHLESSISKTCRLLPTKTCMLSANKAVQADSACTWTIGVTKAHAKLMKGTKKQMSKFKHAVADMIKEGEHVLNLCEFMFDKEGKPRDAGRTEMISWMLNTTSIPGCVKLEGLTVQTNDELSPLTTDCLNQDDVENLQVFFRNEHWLNHLKDNFASRTTDIASIVDVTAVTHASRDEMDVFVQCMASVNDYLLKRTQYFNAQTANLLKGKLPLAAENEGFAQLVTFCQPRLNFMLLETGQRICDKEICDTGDFATEVTNLVNAAQLKMTREDQRQINLAQSNFDQAQEKLAVSRGYESAAAMKKGVMGAATVVGTTVSGATAVACIPGGVAGMVWAEAAIFTTGASVAGTIGGLATCGIGFLVLGAIGTMYLHHRHREQSEDKKRSEKNEAQTREEKKKQEILSKQLAQLFVKTYKLLEDLNTASQQTKDAYQRQWVTLKGLQVQVARLVHGLVDGEPEAE